MLAQTSTKISGPPPPPTKTPGYVPGGGGTNAIIEFVKMHKIVKLYHILNNLIHILNKERPTGFLFKIVSQVLMPLFNGLFSQMVKFTVPD